MSYGDIIRSARKKAGLTQDGLAQKICVSRSAIYDWESEKYPPTDAKNIAALETALGLQNGELYQLIYGNPINPAQEETDC